MARRILTLLAAITAAALIAPTFASAQYGTTTTTAPPTTTTSASVAGITVPSLPPVTLPNLPGVTSTTLRLAASEIDLGTLLSGNIQAIINQLSAPERSEAARRVAQVLQQILDTPGINVNDIVIVGGATVEQGEDPSVPKTFSFSTNGYSAFAVVTFIVESEPQLLGAATADESGAVSGSFELPADLEPGTHTISSVGAGPDGEPVVSQTTIEVAAAPVADDDTETAAPKSTSDEGGANTGVWVVLGLLVALALIGGIVVSSTGTKTAGASGEDTSK